MFAVGSWAGYPVFLFCLCFSRSFSVWYCCFCFRLVYSSFCIYNRKNTYTNRNKQNNTRRKQQTHFFKSRNALFPSRNLRDIYSRSGPGLDILYLCCFMCCFYRSFSVLCLFLSVVFLFSPSLFKLLPEHNTTHYTKHKQTWNGFVHDLCQMLKVMFKFTSNYMTFAADLKGVFVALK